MKWQPIETAPRNGTEVLLFRAGECRRGMWCDQKYHGKPRPYWSDDMERGLGVNWCRENSPTHWMPLPAPPAPPTT